MKDDAKGCTRIYMKYRAWVVAFVIRETVSLQAELRRVGGPHKLKALVS